MKLFKAIIRLYPKSFRMRYGEEMLDVYEQMLADAGGETKKVSRRATLDLFINLLRERGLPVKKRLLPIGIVISLLGPALTTMAVYSFVVTIFGRHLLETGEFLEPTILGTVVFTVSWYGALFIGLIYTLLGLLALFDKNPPQQAVNADEPKAIRTKKYNLPVVLLVIGSTLLITLRLARAIYYSIEVSTNEGTTVESYEVGLLEHGLTVGAIALTLFGMAKLVLLSRNSTEAQPQVPLLVIGTGAILSAVPGLSAWLNSEPSSQVGPNIGGGLLLIVAGGLILSGLVGLIVKKNGLGQLIAAGALLSLLGFFVHVLGGIAVPAATDDDEPTAPALYDSLGFDIRAPEGINEEPSSATRMPLIDNGIIGYGFSVEGRVTTSGEPIRFNIMQYRTDLDFVDETICYKQYDAVLNIKTNEECLLITPPDQQPAIYFSDPGGINDYGNIVEERFAFMELDDSTIVLTSRSLTPELAQDIFASLQTIDNQRAIELGIRDIHYWGPEP